MSRCFFHDSQELRSSWVERAKRLRRWNPMTHIGLTCTISHRSNCNLSNTNTHWECCTWKIWEAKLPSRSDNLIILLSRRVQWKLTMKKSFKFNISLKIRWDDEFFHFQMPRSRQVLHGRSLVSISTLNILAYELWHFNCRSGSKYLLTKLIFQRYTQRVWNSNSIRIYLSNYLSTRITLQRGQIHQPPKGKRNKRLINVLQHEKWINLNRYLIILLPFTKPFRIWGEVEERKTNDER